MESDDGKKKEAAAAAAFAVLVEEECKAVAQEHLLSTAADFVEQRRKEREEPIAEAAGTCVEEVVALLAHGVVVDAAREYAQEVVKEQKLVTARDELMAEVTPGLIQGVAREELDSFEINGAFDALSEEIMVSEVQNFLFDIYPTMEAAMREKQRQDDEDKVVARMGKFLFRHAAMRQLSRAAAQRHDDFFVREKNQEALVHRIMLTRLAEILFANCAYRSGDGAKA